MDSLATMAKVGLGFAFGYSGSTGTLGPSIAIAVEGHARDAFPQANLSKMTGALALSQESKTGKQRSCVRQLPQQCL